MATFNNDIISINHETVKPGERKTISLPMPMLYDCTPTSIPIHVINGEEAGPVLCVTAAIHGDELNGSEIIRRFIKRRGLRKIKGTIIALPIVNVYGFLNQTRYLMDRRDLNRSFPGSEKGTIGGRICHILMTEVFKHGTHFVDLHTGSLHRSNFPQTRANISHQASVELAEAFNAPILVNTAEMDGTFRKTITQKGLPFIVYEAGEALRLDEFMIRTGLNGLMNILRKLGMLNDAKDKSETADTAIAQSSYWVRSAQSGLLSKSKPLGTKVVKGDTLCSITNPYTNEIHELDSPIGGIIIGKSNLPLVYEGAALFHIASFQQIADTEIEENIQALKLAHADYVYTL